MSRNASGTYSLPAGNPVITGTTVTADWANDTMTDLATEMTASLERSGKGPMLAPLKLTAGLISAPSLTFNDETTLGLYRKSAGVMAVALSSGDLAKFAATTALEVYRSAAFHAVMDRGTAETISGLKTFTAATVMAGVQLTPAAAPSHSEGLLAYDSTNKGFIGYVDEAEVTLNIGEEIWIRAKNTTGSTITNGQVVYVNGASGQKPTIALADASVRATAETVGVATHDIETATEGFVTTFGLVRDVNTAAFSAGDALYLSETAGALTATKPTGAGVYKVAVAHCLNAHATQGLLLVDISLAQDFTDMAMVGAIDGVAIGGTTPAAGAFTTLTASGQAEFNSLLTIWDSSADNCAWRMQSDVEFERTLTVRTGAVARWKWIFASNDAEAGSDAGSDFLLRPFDDAGAAISGAFFGIKRSTGNVTLGFVPSGDDGVNKLQVDGGIVVRAAVGMGYATGAGGAVTQITDRTTGVTVNTPTGAITLVSAAGSTSWQTFTVTNSKVIATDTVIVNQKSGTDLNRIHVTAVGAGSFDVSFATTGGTTTEQPVFNFAVIKGVTS